MSRLESRCIRILGSLRRRIKRPSYRLLDYVGPMCYVPRMRQAEEEELPPVEGLLSALMDHIHAIIEGRLAVEYADYLGDLSDNKKSWFWRKMVWIGKWWQKESKKKKTFAIAGYTDGARTEALPHRSLRILVTQQTD